MKKEITWHSSVNYVEPNDVNMITYEDENGVTHYVERAPKLEDFCIALGLEVELSSRSLDIEIDRDSRKLTMIYKNDKNGNTVNFYRGSVFDGNGEATFLTSYYVDMTSDDIKNYGTTEMLGIKSVNVEYDQFCIPQITIVFTDVRGMSLFQPSEMVREMKTKGFAELDSKNVTNAFFRSFFLTPPAKFTIYLKGLYGQPVAYQMTCVDFRASFDSENGSFDTTVKFVGYTFSFLTEVSVNALIAAPYSDYEGDKYWQENIANGRFKLKANNDNTNDYRPMPTLCELVTDIYRVTNESAIEIANSDVAAPLKDNEEEIMELQKIVDLYTTWYEVLFRAINENLGGVTREDGLTRAAQAIKLSQSNSYYDFGVVYISTKSPVDYTINSLEDIFNQISQNQNNGVLSAHNELKTTIETYNQYHSTKLNDVPDLKQFTVQKFIKNIVPVVSADEQRKLLRYEYTLDRDSVFNKEFVSKYPRLVDNEVLRYGFEKRNNSGTNTSLGAIYVNVDYSNVISRIKTLSNEYSNEQKEDARAAIEKLQKERILQKLSWYPSIENFTKIMMAHLETLMHILYFAVEKTKGRKASELGVTLGIDGQGLNCSDVPSDSKTVPPFPRVTTTRTEVGAAGETITVKEDTWIGDIGNSKAFVEVEVVNGLLNAANEVNAKIQQTFAAANEYGRQVKTTTDEDSCIVPFPLTSFDYFLTETPYGNTDRVISNFASFAASVALRMYSVLGINHYAVEFNSDDFKFLSDENLKCIGAVEAENFVALNRLTNVDLRTSLSNKTLKSKDILDIVEGKNTTYKSGDKWPWDMGSTSQPLFKESDFYPNFETEDGNLYPLQGIDFSDINNEFAIYTQKKVNFADNRNIVSPLLGDENVDVLSMGVGSSNSMLNYSLVILDKFAKINTFITNGQSESTNEDYQKLAETIREKSFNDNGNVDAAIWKMFCFNRGSEVNPTSFAKKVGSNELNHSDRSLRVVKNDGIFLYDPDGRDSSGNIAKVQYDSSPESGLKDYLTDEKEKPNIQTVFLTEVMNFAKGTVVNSGSYSVTTGSSLFMNKEYYEIGKGDGWDKQSFGGKYVQAAFFVMCLQAIDYNEVNSYVKGRTHVFLPRFVALQIGAFFAAQYYANGKNLNNTVNTIKIIKILPLPKDFGKLGEYLSTLSKTAKLAYIRYFMNWASSSEIKECLEKFEMVHKTFGENERKVPYNDEEAKRIAGDTSHKVSQLVTNDYKTYWLPKKDVYRAAVVVDGSIKYEGSIDASKVRLLFNERDVYVQRMTNSLLQMVCITKCHNFNDKSDYSLKKEKHPIDITKAATYLDAFLDKLSDIVNGVQNNEQSANNLPHIAQDPTQVTVDMKIALYLYLKQLYDKWMPNTSMDDWMFDKFFGSSTKGDDDDDLTRNGHKFHFIDSFYTKIGQKLMINPEALAEALQRSMMSPDWNAMMLQFMSDIYGKHHCIFKCVQNFNDITTKESMNEMFLPISYFDMKKPKKNPDFVIIYTYQRSSHLNLGQGQYEDDGFMLNDKDKSPMAIATRTLPTSNNNDSESNVGWYQLPAFGVVYGSQYQSFFKKIDINMDNPIATESAIGAKYRVGNMYRIDSKQTFVTTAQDLYDIYSNRSYTCKIQMMGCAWIQPLMYFVLLNVPLFNGSYIIIQVTHKMTPGNMDTEIVGVRMSKVATRLTDEIFSDMEHNRIGRSPQEIEYSLADSSNDCDYKFFPMHEFNGEIDASADVLELGYQIMCYLISNGNFTEITAAATVGNMRIESGGKLDYTAINPNDRGYISGSLCQWRAGNLICAASGNTPNPSKFWCIGESEASSTKATSENADFWKDRLKNHRTLTQMVQFYIDTFNNASNCFSKTISDFNSKTTIDSATEWWYDNYGVGYGAPNRRNPPSEEAKKYRLATLGQTSFLEEAKGPSGSLTRKGCAQRAYNYFIEKGGVSGIQTNASQNSQTEERDFAILFRDSVLKTLRYTCDSARADGKIKEGQFTINQDTKIPAKYVWFTESSKRCYKIFDIVLTTYYDYVQSVNWITTQNGIGEDPIAVVVFPREKEEVKAELRKVSVIDNESSREYSSVPNNININFFRTLRKVYVANDDTSKPSKGDKLIGMVDNNGKFTSDIKKGLDLVEIQNCNEIINGLTSTASSPFNGVATLAGYNQNITNPKMRIILDVDNNGAALDWIDSNSMRKNQTIGSDRRKTVNGKELIRLTQTYYGACTSGPTTWYNRVGFVAVNETTGAKEAFSADRWWSYGGGSVSTSTYAATAKYFHALRPAEGGTTGFKLVWHGNLSNCGNSSSPADKKNTVWGGSASGDFVIKPGDIATFHIKKGSGGASSHGVMWTGKDWRSDAIQNALSCYGTKGVGRDGDYSVCIWRHPDLQEPGETVIEVQ